MHIFTTRFIEQEAQKPRNISSLFSSFRFESRLQDRSRNLCEVEDSKNLSVLISQIEIDTERFLGTLRILGNARKVWGLANNPLTT